jgi:hypothetical protein
MLRILKFVYFPPIGLTLFIKIGLNLKKVLILKEKDALCVGQTFYRATLVGFVGAFLKAQTPRASLDLRVGIP